MNLESRCKREFCESPSPSVDGLPSTQSERKIIEMHV